MILYEMMTGKAPFEGDTAPSVVERCLDCGNPHGKEAKDLERMDCLEFIARVTSHIPDKGQVTVR